MFLLVENYNLTAPGCCGLSVADREFLECIRHFFEGHLASTVRAQWSPRWKEGSDEKERQERTVRKYSDYEKEDEEDCHFGM